MYSLTLEINQICNLECKYCYLGDKNGNKMSAETAGSAVDMGFEKTKMHKDKTLSISFVGGEPLLDFDFIKETVLYIESLNMEYHYKVLYSITTNATVITQEMIEFLCNKNFSLKISLDGNKRVHDLNRIAKGNYSVFDRIMKNWSMLQEYEKCTNKYIQVTNVITGNNYLEYFHTLKFLTKELDLKIIDTAIDLSYEWRQDQIFNLEEQIGKSLHYFAECLKNGTGFFWAFADQLIKVKDKRQRFYSCGAGIVSSYISTDGAIYPCTGCMDEKVLLGNVKYGFDQVKLKWLKGFKSIDNDECKVCSFYECCSDKACIMGNIAFSGNADKPVPFSCQMTKFMNQLYDENLELMNFCKQLKRETFERERNMLNKNEQKIY